MISTQIQPQAVLIDYTNWRGERRVRSILPQRIAFCANEWHPVAQWMIFAIDLDDKAPRIEKGFALANIHDWGPV